MKTKVISAILILSLPFFIISCEPNKEYIEKSNKEYEEIIKHPYIYGGRGV
jgi:hypothetical protein